MTIIELPFPISVNAMVEVWKPVPGFEGAFEVSDLGNLRSVDRVVDHPRSGKLRLRGKPMKAHTNKKNGYLMVHLNFNKKIAFRTVHSLVAEAFLGAKPIGLYALHRDGVRANCSASNLYYGTQKQNLADAAAHGALAIGSYVRGAVLSEEQVRRIRILAKTKTRSEIAHEFEVHPGTVGAILRGQTWRHVL